MHHVRRALLFLLLLVVLIAGLLLEGALEREMVLEHVQHASTH